VPARETHGEPSTMCDQSVGEVSPVIRCKSDNSHDAPGLDQIGKPGEAFFGIHVMKGGDRHHGVERTSLEGNVKEVALPPLDRDANVTRPRSVEYCLVQVEPDDVRNAGPSQPRRQHAVTASNVQNATRSVRNRLDEQRMVVNIGVPELLGCHPTRDYSDQSPRDFLSGPERIGSPFGVYRG
jgi:hypothetical protein